MVNTLLHICRDYWRSILLFLSGGISQTFIGLLSIFYLQQLLDSITNAQQFADVTPVLGWYIGLTITNHLLIYLEGYPSSIIRNGTYQWVKLRAMQKIARIDFLAYQDLGTGNLIQLIENGATATRNILTGFYLNILRGILPGLIITFAFIGYYDQTLFLIIFGLYAVLYLVSYRLMIALRTEVDKMLTNQEDFSKFSVRGFMELVVFRVNGRFKQEIERVRLLSDEVVQSQAKVYLVQELFFTGFAFLVFFLEVFVIIRQANLIIAGTSTIGTLVALTAFISNVAAPISSFSHAYVNFKLDSVAFRRLEEFLALPEDAGLAQSMPLAVNTGQITLKQMAFSYPEKSVFRNLSFTFAGGQTTALVGSSGGGKSTLVRLLLHLLKPSGGQIMVDNQNLAEINLASYYREVAYIPQEPPIFDGTIRENLAFDQPVNDESMDEVIEQVGLKAFISDLPDGLETIVGERGIKLSGGERQRLAFGRLLVQNPKIVVLDEPTSALDSITEQFVTQNLVKFLRGKTVIIIAHRLQTVKEADTIVVLDGGKIVQQGSFDRLVAEDGPFRRLWAEQTRDRRGSDKL